MCNQGAATLDIRYGYLSEAVADFHWFQLISAGFSVKSLKNAQLKPGSINFSTMFLRQWMFNGREWLLGKCHPASLRACGAVIQWLMICGNHLHMGNVSLPCLFSMGLGKGLVDLKGPTVIWSHSGATARPRCYPTK